MAGILNYNGYNPSSNGLSEGSAPNNANASVFVTETNVQDTTTVVNVASWADLLNALTALKGNADADRDGFSWQYNVAVNCTTSVNADGKFTRTCI